MDGVLMASTDAGYHTKPMECLRVLWHLFQDLAIEDLRAVEIARSVLLPLRSVPQ
jgi:hypothetical protein